jgi:branched-subunit amino acid ABC-type transport system permease component
MTLASTTRSLAAIAGVLLAFIALESLRPRLLPPAFAFTFAGLIVGGEGAGLSLPEAAVLAIVLAATTPARPGGGDRRAPAGLDPRGAQRRERPQRRPLRPRADHR